MFFEWSFYTIVAIISLYLAIKMFYFKNLNIQEKRNSDMMKLTLQEAEILIRKYQIQLQRSLGNIDILTDELTKIRNDMKALKQRNAQHRIEVERSRSSIKELESRIEALL